MCLLICASRGLMHKPKHGALTTVKHCQNVRVYWLALFVFVKKNISYLILLKTSVPNKHNSLNINHIYDFRDVHFIGYFIFRWPWISLWFLVNDQLDRFMCRSSTHSDIYQMYWYNWSSWWWARGYSKHVENWNKYIKKIVRQVRHLLRIFIRIVPPLGCGWSVTDFWSWDAQ